ncbi:solute carrier family 35 member C2 [Diachasmimorpha longicaudata]|uniref:solute carrier family 35 member C2 n=1 Tax=Diachasmimorpha longicaudata TaxID=58733 RepID=UPI0030B8AA39
MPRSDIKYEIARNDPDTTEYYLQHAEDYQPTTKGGKTFGRTVVVSLVLIGFYFVLSVGLTFFQQWFNHKYHYPLSTVLCHLIVKWSLSAVIKNFLRCMNSRSHQQMRPTWPSIISTIAPPGIASGLDIGFSNWAISMITVSLYTMTKSTAIIFILGFSLLFHLERKSWSLVGVVSMISTGLIMFTYKSTQFQLLGFLLCLAASFLSGIRWTMAQLIMQKSKLGLNNPIDMIYYMQPWMLIAIIPLVVWFESGKLYAELHSIDWSQSGLVSWTVGAVLGGAILAFIMEIAEYMVVTHTSSLTLSISNIVKELCTVVLAVEFKGDEMSGLNAIGLLVCLGGITLHVIQKILLHKKQMSDNLELHSNSVTSNTSTFDDTGGTNVPLLNEKSTSLTNLLSSNFSTDDEDDFKDKDNNSDVLFDILQRREQS